MSRLKKFFSILTALLFVLTFTSNVVFANEESDAHNLKGNEFFNNAKNEQDYQKAVAEYTAAIEINGNDSIYYSNRGGAYFNLKNYAAAETDFNKAIQIDAKNGHAYFGRAKLYQEQGKTAEATNDFEAAGDIFYDNNNFDEAATSYTSAMELDKGSAVYPSYLGWTYYMQDKYEDALNYFNQALQLNSEYANAYEGRGLVYSETGKKDEAARDFMTAGVNYYLYALNSEDAADTKEFLDSAKGAFNRVIEVDKSNAEAYFRLGLVDCTGSNYPEAIKNFDKAIALNISPELKDDTYFNRGWANYMLNNYTEAIKDFDESISADKGKADAYEYRALSYYALADYEKAGKDFESLVKLDSSKAAEYIDEIKTCKVTVEGGDSRSTDGKTTSAELTTLEGFFGPFNGLLKALLIVMVIDYAIKIGCGLYEGTLTSGIVAQNLLLKFIFLIIVLVTHSLDEADILGIDVRNVFVSIILVYELFSVIENSERLGVPVPTWLKETLQKIRDTVKLN